MSVAFGICLPNVGEFGDPRVLTLLAVEAEEYGWDGVFLNDHVLYHDPTWPVANPTVTLGAIAISTSRIRLGTALTALPRRRPQVVAREIATLDVLSEGRVIFGAALGSMDAEYEAFGEPAALRERAARLDESLTVLDELWRGSTVEFRGDHVRADGVHMVPTPVQRPRVPIWCAGRWPARAGFRRAARWDGIIPTHADHGRGSTMPPSELASILAFIAAERGDLDGFDVALEGHTEAGDSVADYAEAGLTWWLEAPGWWRGGVTEARQRIAAGPPRV